MYVTYCIDVMRVCTARYACVLCMYVSRYGCTRVRSVCSVCYACMCVCMYVCMLFMYGCMYVCMICAVCMCERNICNV